MKREHSMGVSVTEIRPEIRIASDDGDGEFVQQSADDAAHEHHGNEHRRQRHGHGQNGEGDFRASP